MMKDCMILGLSASKEFASKIKKRLKMEVIDPEVERFADGETLIKLQESVRGKVVYIVQSTSNPVNDNLMELLVAIDACKRASASKINVVIPYFGYSRQDRKAAARQPITAKLVAGMIENAGANRVITFDLHAPQIQGFFDIPVDDLEALGVIAASIKNMLKSSSPVVVAPDHGGSKRARTLADILGCDIAVIDKKRPKANEVEVMGMIGSVKGLDAIIIDDMIDTGGTICKASEAVMKEGAKSVSIAATHGVLSGPAIERLNASPCKNIILTDTIETSKINDIKNLIKVSLADFVADVIEANYEHKSVGAVYDKYTKVKIKK